MIKFYNSLKEFAKEKWIWYANLITKKNKWKKINLVPIPKGARFLEIDEKWVLQNIVNNLWK